MRKRLSDFFTPDQIARDGAFAELGHADSPVPGTLAYCDSVFYLKAADSNPNVTCMLTTAELSARVSPGKGLAVLANPRNAFYRLHERLDPGFAAAPGQTRIHPSAIVAPEARIGAGVVIAERAVVKGDVELGDECFVDVGAIIGAEGLLYLTEGGAHHRIHHRGGVRVGKGATILANAVVARAIHPGVPTVIGDYATVGIASNIGHEAILGRNSVVSGNCVIARGARIGDDAWIGTSAMVREYVRIGARASVKAGSVVVEDVPDDAEVSGNFAIPHGRRMMQYLKDKK